MENQDELVSLAYEILSCYSIFTNVHQENEGVLFEHESRAYKLWVFSDRYSRPAITMVGERKLYPHYLTDELVLGGVNYQRVCLFDDIEYVNAVIEPEEKITDVINRFVALVSLNHVEIEAEYQKEFLLYWHRAITYCGVKNELYLYENFDHCWLEKREMSKTLFRYIEKSDIFNDKTAQMYVDKKPAFFARIFNTQGVYPPLPNKPWNEKVINEILNSPQIQHISCEAYKELSEVTYSYGKLVVVLCLGNAYFACEIEFKNPGSEKLIKKIESGIVNVRLLDIARCDFAYLSEQIGNDDLLLRKTIAIIGCGSLGSYIAEEIIRAGCKSLIIVDDDTFEYPNVMRHKIPFWFASCSKVQALKYHLEEIHPEVRVLTISKKFDTSTRDIILSLRPDVIISTVGSSDSQLKFNQYFHDIKTNIPVLYSWLEGDGETSHVLCVSYKAEGCYECLFTSENGDLVNNRANRSKTEDFRFIRNGCGGTRVAYGNSTLISGSFITLYALKNVISDLEFKPCLYSFINNSIQQNKGFVSERCRCCGKH